MLQKWLDSKIKLDKFQLLVCQLCCHSTCMIKSRWPCFCRPMLCHKWPIDEPNAVPMNVTVGKGAKLIAMEVLVSVSLKDLNIRRIVIKLDISICKCVELRPAGYRWPNAAVIATRSTDLLWQNFCFIKYGTNCGEIRWICLFVFHNALETRLPSV